MPPAKIAWRQISPDPQHAWLTEDLDEGFEAFLPLSSESAEVFECHSLGISTNRDSFVYGFDRKTIARNAEEFLVAYDTAVDRFRRQGRPEDIDKFVENSPLKWSRNLKRHLKAEERVEFATENIRTVFYRPFTRQYLYLSDIAVDEPSHTGDYFPKNDKESGNRLISITDLAGRSAFSTLMTGGPVDLHLCASSDGFQCFPFYTYAGDGTHRRENITDGALDQFRSHYADASITKWDIFSITSTPSSTAPTTASVTPPTSAANSPASRMSARPQTLVIQRRRLLAPKDLCILRAAPTLPTNP